MVDIAMCSGTDCPFALTCRRFCERPGQRQSWINPVSAGLTPDGCPSKLEPAITFDMSWITYRPSASSFLSPKKLRKLTEKDVEVIVTAEEELDNPCDIFDPEVAVHINEELLRGNVWAWADVCVEVSWKGFSEKVYLGASSYEDEEDFRFHNQDLVSEALDSLNKRIEEVYNELSELEEK